MTETHTTPREASESSGPSIQSQYIGVVEMLPDGSLLLHLRSQSPSGALAESSRQVFEGDPLYLPTIERVGGLTKGAKKPLPAWGDAPSLPKAREFFKEFWSALGHQSPLLQTMCSEQVYQVLSNHEERRLPFTTRLELLDIQFSDGPEDTVLVRVNHLKEQPLFGSYGYYFVLRHHENSWEVVDINVGD